MRYRVLGSIEVADEGRPIAIGRGKPRVLLAALLIDANRGVSVDELVERLWAGESPPTATKSVQVLVSQLRRALGGDDGAPIATVGSGYMLRVGEGETDVDVFEELLERGRGQLGEGHPDDAEATLNEALGLWRGRAYEDVAYEDFARNEIARLEERRLVATEERFEAMLAAGRHVDAVAGLERLAAEQPLRDRVLGLLMRALYRSGRRADALAVYDAARLRLSEQLGIEPGEPLRRLHAAILEGGGADDDALGGVDLEAPQKRRFPARAIALAGAALLAAAVAVAALASHGGGSARIVHLHGDSVGLIQPASGHVVGQYNVRTVPSQVVADAHTAWTLNAADQTISRVDLATGRVRSMGTAVTPTAVALGHGSLWVSYANPLPKYGMYAIGVLRLDPATLQPLARIPLAARTFGGGPLPVLVSPDGVWVGASGSAYRVDPTRARRDVRIPISDRRFGAVTVLALAQLRGAIWALTDARSIVRIDPAHRKARVLIRLTAPSYGALVAGAGSLWVSDSFGVWRVSLGPRPQPHDITTGVDASDLTFGDGAAWVTSQVRGTLTRVDAITEHVRSFPVGGAPTAVAVSAAGVLVASAPSSGVIASSCGGVMSAPGVRPQFVVAADLPLYDTTFTLPVASAIRHEFRAHHFTAGRYRVGLQICNDSTPQSKGSGDDLTCGANARAYATVNRIIGIIGPEQSSCSSVEIPILDRHGPVPMVGFGNEPGLTLPEPVSSLYPAGVRNFVRVSSRYDQWGYAGALLAKQLGLRRVYVYQRDPQGFYDSIMAPPFAQEARRLGIQVIGPASPAGGFRALAKRLVAQGVDGVFDASDYLNPGFVTAIRAGMGRSTVFIAPDSFLPYLGQTAAQLRMERGIYVLGADFTDPGRQLPANGRAVVAKVARGQLAGAMDFWVPYGVEATDVLLAAIAHSHGTRASVAHALFHVRIRNGVLGSFTFTREGDSSRGIVLAYRVVPGFPGVRPVAVFRVPASAN